MCVHVCSCVLDPDSKETLVSLSVPHFFKWLSEGQFMVLGLKLKLDSGVGGVRG